MFVLNQHAWVLKLLDGLNLKSIKKYNMKFGTDNSQNNLNYVIKFYAD